MMEKQSVQPSSPLSLPNQVPCSKNLLDLEKVLSLQCNAVPNQTARFSMNTQKDSLMHSLLTLLIPGVMEYAPVEIVELVKMVKQVKLVLMEKRNPPFPLWPQECLPL